VAVNKYHLSRQSVNTFALQDDAVTREKAHEQFIQSGSATLSLPFSAAGVETVTATITFATAFPSGVIPRVIVWPKDMLAIT